MRIGGRKNSGAEIIGSPGRKERGMSDIPEWSLTRNRPGSNWGRTHSWKSQLAASPRDPG